MSAPRVTWWRAGPLAACWGGRLVVVYARGRSVFIWRRDPKWWGERPVWRVSLPRGVIVEKWAR